MSADGQSLDGLSFSLYSNLCLCLSFAQEHFWVKNFELHGGEHSSTGGHAYLREVVSIGSLSPLLGILAKVISIGSWDLLDSLDFISFSVFLPSFLLSFLPSFLPFSFRQGFSVLDLTLYTRLALNSEICLPLPPNCCD